MKKISIVGVEGSGKTVLMSVLGQKYAEPDRNHLSLKAKSVETFKFCTTTVAAMHKGEWPTATQPGEITRLEWQLLRHNRRAEPVVLGDITTLDFAGEVYRQAFGGNPTEHKTGDDVKALLNHISQSDILIVLVNLKDVIDGDRTEDRTIETLWLSQAIFDFAKTGKVKCVATLMSQVDRYQEIINKCGGIVRAFQKYLPHVAYAFPKMPVFAVSAVHGVVNNDGRETPAEDFNSSGLAEMMFWLQSCVSPRRIVLKLLFVLLICIAGVFLYLYFEGYYENIEIFNELKIGDLL